MRISDVEMTSDAVCYVRINDKVDIRFEDCTSPDGKPQLRVCFFAAETLSDPLQELLLDIGEFEAATAAEARDECA